MKNEFLNISLNELAEVEGLSTRSINVCKYYSMNDIKAILQYYYEFGDFLRLRNSGRKSNLELISLCLKYENQTEDFPNNPVNEKDDSDFNKNLEELVSTEGLSIRCQNLCDDNHLKDLKSIVDYYLENKNFRNFRRCGELSDRELVNLCKKYEKRFIQSK
jgi:hypothetical protein